MTEDSAATAAAPRSRAIGGAGTLLLTLMLGMIVLFVPALAMSEGFGISPAMEPLRLALSLAVAAAALAVGGYFAVLALNNPPKPGDPPGRDGKPKWHPVAYVTFPLIMAGLYFFETSLLALPLFDVVAVKLPYRAMFQNVSWSGHRRGCDTVVLRNAEAESFTFCVSTDLRLPLRRSKHILVVGTRSAFGIRAHQMLKQD